MTKETVKTYREAIKLYGSENQLVKAMEEMAELTVEISKNIAGENNRERVIEEWNDVMIMLEQMGIIFKITKKEVAKYRFFKLERLRERIRNGKLNNSSGKTDKGRRTKKNSDE